MKATLLMAASANGYAARPDGQEDFLPHDGWIAMLEFCKKYHHVIWGRTTYDAVKTWGGSYLNDLQGFEIIVVSRSAVSYPEQNVTICSSPEEAIEHVKEKGYAK